MTQSIMSGPQVLPPPLRDLPGAGYVHAQFCIVRETAKWIRTVAGVAELMSVGMVLWLSFERQGGHLWLPVLILVFTLIDVFLRLWVASLRRFAQQCRRVSLRAFVAQQDIDLAVLALIRSQVPGVAEILCGRMQTPSLQEYYDPVSITSVKLRRELYAENAYFSWHLMRSNSLLHGAALVALVGAVITVLYNLAGRSQYVAGTRQMVLELLFTVILVYMATRLLEALCRAQAMARAYRDLYFAMMRAEDQSMVDLAEEYDFERAEGVDVPTLLYKCYNASLTREWREIRKGLV